MSDLGPEDASLDVREEPDGILRLEIHGELTEDRARVLVAALQRASEGGRDVLLLADVRRMGSFLAPARKVTADGVRSARIGAVAIIGPSFSLRVIATLIAKGVQMLTSQPYPQQFFEAEGEARAWLLARRDALRAGRRPGT
ncbi:STAS/SEC14 domain-containing protein [Sorangium sp. So ce726]|uniref:STAS/SEC14 domain-containing protein n=1 Tax=Sorangium sp. So ce726 TaxID=3133319 RepID=UPI003F63C4EC